MSATDRKNPIRVGLKQVNRTLLRLLDLIPLPGWLVHGLNWLITTVFYRMEVIGAENVPWQGGVMLASNHVSFLDAAFVARVCPRKPRFMILDEMYTNPLVRPFARAWRCIPVSSRFNLRKLVRSLRLATGAIEKGEVICVFPEGEITRIGSILPFQRGLERIMRDVDAPIVPVHLDCVWGSIFSFERGKFFFKWPQRWRRRITVSFGAPLPHTATAAEVRQAVVELHTRGYALHKRHLRPLHRTLIGKGRWHPFRFAMADPRVPKLSYGSALIKTIFLARRLARVWEGQERVGILVPPSVAGALVNAAAALLGKISVNLNYTASAEVLALCARQCELKTILTSRAFMEKVALELPFGVTVLYLEDIADKPRTPEKLAAMLFAYAIPVRMLERALGRPRPSSLDEVATIIFSSGSTGEPKGVPLTHYNIAANIEQMLQVFRLDSRDRMLGILPFFHSFGYSVTLWLPITVGMGSVFYPNPLDAKLIGGMCSAYGVTFMIATPTFLLTYLRRCEPADFGSLRYVIAGAEKLQTRVADAFEQKFGIRPLEGYGCTECSPVVAVNVSDYRATGIRQIGTKEGTIGRPLPGISTRIVHPETQEKLPFGETGLLLVAGPNVMSGYFRQPERTAQVLDQGWYNTGDLAALDEEGFLRIADRLSRFSKIGGEMVPHLKIEEELQIAAGITERAFVVLGVPDEKRGERLVVLHTQESGQLEKTIQRFEVADLPALWKPRRNHFLRVDEIPHLGSGKVDLARARQIAATHGEETASLTSEKYTSVK